MNCRDVQQELDTRFDLGEAPGDALRQHLDSCPACQAYHHALDGLDKTLRVSTPVEEDSALIARIQAAVSREPRPLTFPPWMGLAVAAAVVVLSLAGGWVIDAYGHVPYSALAEFRPTEPLMPDWEMLRAEIGAIPSELRLEATTTAAQVTEFWRSNGRGLWSVIAGNSTIFWGACLAGLVLVALIDGREVRRQA